MPMTLRFAPARVLVMLLAVVANAKRKKKPQPKPAHECGHKQLHDRNLTGCTSLEHIKHIGHRSVVWIGEKLHDNVELRFLDLHHTGLHDDDAVSIASGLHNNTHLKRIALHNNRFTDVAAIAFAEALKHNQELEVLSISSNNVSNAGAIALAEAMRTNHHLRRLDLYHNSVGDDGAVAFGEVLSWNRGLRMLHLDSNRIGPRGALALAAGLQGEPSGHPPRLGELTLLYNQMDDAAVMALSAAAHSNPNVHKLAITQNSQASPAAFDAAKHLLSELKEREAVATWLHDNDLLVGERAGHPTHNLHAFGWLGSQGPPLASPLAAAAKELRLHTRDGLLSHRENTALEKHPALAKLPVEERGLIARAVRTKLDELAAADKDEI